MTLPENWQEWLEARKPELTMLLIGMVIIGAGVFVLKSGGGEGVQVLSFDTTATEEAEIMADISGAVNNPGVYKFTNNSRIGEALEKAGGLAQDADVNWVEANVNKARKLADGEKIFIPHVNTQTSGSDMRINTPNQSLVSINKGSVSELDTLPGVGTATANKIIAGRPYQSVEDLINRKIVGQKVYGQIKDLVALW